MIDSRREKLKQWKLQKAQQQLAKEKNNGKKCHNNNSRITTRINHNVDTRRRNKTNKLSMKTNRTNINKSNNMKRKHIGMDKENCNKNRNIMNKSENNITARKRSNVVIKNKPKSTSSRLVVDIGKDKNESTSNTATTSTKSSNSSLVTNTTFSSITTQTSSTYHSDSLETPSTVVNSGIKSNNIASQTVFQFVSNAHAYTARGLITKDKCIEALPVCHSVGTSTIHDGEMNESSHYTDLLNKLNDTKMVVKEKDATINKLKFAHEITLQQMCELQDELNESREKEESIKLQLEQFKTQLVMNLQVALQKNKQLKYENDLLKQQSLVSKNEK